MKSLTRALRTAVLAVALGGGLVGSASADESGLSSDDAAPGEAAAPHRSNRAPASKRAPAASADRSGFGPRRDAPRVVLLDEPVQKDAPPVPLAADISNQTLGMGLSSEPALAASLVALGCLISWRRRSKLARRGAWAP